jgi:hypothetical protein
MERKPKSNDFIGKTIAGVDLSCWNQWTFTFADGTKLNIVAHNDILIGAGMVVHEETPNEIR